MEQVRICLEGEDHGGITEGEGISFRRNICDEVMATMKQNGLFSIASLPKLKEFMITVVKCPDLCQCELK